METALARHYASHVPLIANGGVQDAARAQEVMAAGADVLALGKVALANPDFPNRVRAEREMNAFDPAVLGPIANIKPSELAA